eukprot:5649508-Amphidinium_carterae.1
MESLQRGSVLMQEDEISSCTFIARGMPSKRDRLQTMFPHQFLWSARMLTQNMATECRIVKLGLALSHSQCHIVDTKRL